MDRREYVCNQMYKQHDLLRKGSWTDADKLEYMELSSVFEILENGNEEST